MRVLYGLMLVRCFARLAPARHGASILTVDRIVASALFISSRRTPVHPSDIVTRHRRGGL
jgi:hypothetical protein